MRLRRLSPLLAAATLAACRADQPRAAGRTPGRAAEVAADSIAAAARALRPNPLADDRLHTHQGGPLCNRTDVRDLTPFRREMPEFPKEDLSAHPTFDCKPGPDGRALRLQAIGEKTGWVDSVLVFAAWSAPRPIQVLRLDEGEPPALGADFLQGIDLNQDGWMDVKVGRFWGATGNEIYDIFMYDPDRGAFVRDTVLSEGSHIDPVEGRPCVRTGSVFGDAGLLHSHAEFCWIDGRWTKTWSESQVDLPARGPSGPFRYQRTTRKRLPGGRYTTRVDTLDSGEASDFTPPGGSEVP